MKTQTLVAGLAVTYRLAADLKPHHQNARTHSSKQVGHIVKSMSDYGWTNPILIDEEGNVLAGHGRLEAAKRMGISEVPTIILSHMTPAQKRAYIIADNRVSETAGSWDRKLLALEHEAIQLMDPDFDLTSTGFDLDEMRSCLKTVSRARETRCPRPTEADQQCQRSAISGRWASTGCSAAMRFSAQALKS